MKKLKVGILSFAHSHARSYLKELLTLPEVEVVGIADEVYSRVEEIVRQTGIPYFSDYRDLLGSEADAIIICSENARHAEHVIATAQAGKHALCEKPLGLSVGEMEQMIAACDDNNVQLMTAFPCRFLAAIIRAKEVVDRGEIGEIIAIKGRNRGIAPGGWFVDRKLSGGGALMDHTVHIMDLMNWFTGSRVEQVYAYSATIFHQELEVDDVGLIHVNFASGVFGVIDASWSRPKSFPTWGDVALEIIGTQGTISVDGLAQINEIYSDEAGKGQWRFWGDSMDHYMVQSFVQALLIGRPVPVTGLDGLRSTEVALAGYTSARQGQPIRIG